MIRNSWIYLLLAFCWLLPIEIMAQCPPGTTITPAFTASPAQMCGAGSYTVNFTNSTNSVGVAASSLTYEWYQNGVLLGTTTGLTAYSASISAEAVYTFVMKAIHPTISGCESSTQRIVIIHPVPQPAFVFSPNNACPGTPITFTNNSGGETNLTSYSWDFVDGSGVQIGGQSDPHETHTFTAAGVYQVKLKMANGGCTDEVIVPVTVGGSGGGNIDIDVEDSDGDTLYCSTNGSPTNTVTLKNNSTTGTSYVWDFGDGSPTETKTTTADFTHTYTAFGTFKVLMTAAGGACGGGKDSVYVVSQAMPVADFTFTPNNSCAGTAVQFTNNSSGGGSYHWDFGDGNSSTQLDPSHIFSSGNTYNVTLSDTNGFCVNQITKPVTVLANSTVNVSIDGDDGDGDLATCVAPGNPISSVTVNFTNNTTGSTGPFVWDFGDGSPPMTVNNTNPITHTYTSAGIYPVFMSVNGGTCSSSGMDSLVVTFIKNIKASADIPLADMSGCQPFTVSPVNLSENGYEYIWDFGDGTDPDTTYTMQAPSHTYPNGGNYEITLTVINDCFQAQDKISLIRVSKGPDTFFSSSLTGDKGCAPQTVSFTNLSANAVPANNYFWDMGNGNTYPNTITPPDQTYTPGQYTVSLKAANLCGDSIYTRELIIDDVPEVQLSFDNVEDCHPLVTTPALTTTSQALDYAWYIGASTSPDNSEIISSQQFGHAFGTAPREDSIRLVASNICGVFDTTVYFTIHPKTIANFSLTSDTLCQSDSIQLSGAGMGENLTYSWNTGDGVWKSGAGPHIGKYPLVGGYEVVLAVDGYCGKDTLRDSVFVIGAPHAEIVSDTNKGCEDLVIDFSNNSQTGLLYSWDFGPNAVPSATLDFIPGNVVFPVAGKDTVILVVNEGGCKARDTLVITAYPATVPDFSFSVTGGCAPVSVDFINNSVQNAGDSYSWDMGNGNNYSTYMPGIGTEVYNGGTVDTTYMVKLIIETDQGCKDSLEKDVLVSPIPSADFTLNKDTFCVGETVSFLNASTGANSYNWDLNEFGLFTENAVNPTIVYTDSGHVLIRLVAISAQGCTDTSEAMLFVDTIPTADFLTDTVCFGHFTTFQDISTSDVVKWEWSVVPGQPLLIVSQPTYTMDADGVHQVALTVENISGCRSDTVKDVLVHEMPLPDFSFTTACAKKEIGFTDVSTGTIDDWSWDFDDGSFDVIKDPTHSYLLGNTYQVKLVVMNSISGCKDSIVKAVGVSPVPVPDFVGNNICLGAQTDFATTVSNVLPISGHFWDFDDGNQSFSPNPTYIFQAPGIYDVAYTVTNTSGCDSTVVHQVEVGVVPQAKFTADTVCEGDPTLFTDLSTGNPTNYYWTFGDASSIVDNTVGDVQYQYLSGGNYVAELIVTNGVCSDTTIVPVVVPSNDAANIAVANFGCTGQLVNFTNFPAMNGVGNVFNWTFGDGGTDVNEQTVHLYSDTGVYDVKLTITNSNGCVSKDSVEFMVHPTPNVGFDFSKTCLNELTQFVDTSSIISGQMVGYSWDFDDGATDFLINPSHQYASIGTYDVSLTVQSDKGCVGQKIESVVLSTPPQANFSWVSTSCLNHPINFTDNSLSSVGSINSWSWNFGDGTQTSVQNPTHTYTQYVNPLNVELIIGNTELCFDTLKLPVDLSTPPVFNYQVSSLVGCEGGKINFSDASLPSEATNPIVDLVWDFGDGIQGYTSATSHTYSSPGTYPVVVQLTTQNGCVYYDTLIQDITIYVNPKAGFVFGEEDGAAFSTEIILEDRSVGATKYEWFFGDIGHSNDANPLFDFEQSGDYDVMQVVTTSLGCSDTLVKVIRIESDYTFFIPNTFTPNADGINDYFLLKGEALDQFVLTIYDRWGEQIFITNKFDQGWDGRYKGEMCQQDVYIYSVTYINVEGKETEINGAVQLVR